MRARCISIHGSRMLVFDVFDMTFLKKTITVLNGPALSCGSLSKFVVAAKYHVLGIETSCDDTAAAVVNDSGDILGQSHVSQSRIHVETGGILPNVAHALHVQNLKRVVDSTMHQSKLGFDDIDAIAVTVEPGLILSLTAGVDYAKRLGEEYKKPLIPIHHMEAHALTARMTDKVNFPFLAFLISGGHCMLAFVKSVNDFYTLGQTSDCTPGQLFDKVARRAKLSLLDDLTGLPGGVCIESAAAEGNPTAVPFFDKPLTHRKNCEFSFSGMMNTACRYIESKEKDTELSPDGVISDYKDLCASLQWAVSKHLCQRLEMAMAFSQERKLFDAQARRCLVVSGGVASNAFIRQAIKYVCDHSGYEMVVPPRELCTDNGAMIAWNGIEKLRENFSLVQSEELNSIRPLARSSLGEDISAEVEAVLNNLNYKSVLKLNKFIAKYKSC